MLKRRDYVIVALAVITALLAVAAIINRPVVKSERVELPFPESIVLSVSDRAR